MSSERGLIAPASAAFREPASALPWRVVDGDVKLASGPTLGILSSTRTPPDLYLPTFDLIRSEAEAGTVLVGGFQSPLEADCLDVHLRHGGRAVLCLARSAPRVRLAGVPARALAESRLLVVGPGESPDTRRTSARSAEARNRHVVEISDRLIVPHAAPGSRSYACARLALELGRPVACFAHSTNRDLQLIGATPLPP